MKEERIFHEALERPADQRAAYLDDACGDDGALRQRMEVLLVAHANPGSFLQTPAPALFSSTGQAAVEEPGTAIGRFKLLQQTGEGGMGVVYVAEQLEPVRRQVALKIIKPGMDTKEVIARFEAEKQALAMMDHPNIAKVYDAGATGSGRPYFAMELVHGVPLTDYCDQNELTTDKRLELFVSVCRAVQHAHQKGIIHRDIKPANVMVTLHDSVPVPKIIDFGIAKAMAPHPTERAASTRHGQMVGTPLYMSPEQAQMSGQDVDTRTDIYSLGVLLYELLTGSTPFDEERLRETDFDEVRRMIREEEPPRPSSRISTLAGEAATTVSARRKTEPSKLSHLLRGELDWIVMKAMEKDRTRRYETAKDLAKDAQRYLNDEPVEACPPSTAYRARKFARRHKATLATITALATVLLVVAASVGSVAWNRHQEKTQLARTVDKELNNVRQALETGDLAAAERQLSAARTRLDAARYDLQRLDTDVAALSKEVSARIRAEKRFGEFQQIRERVFSRMYDLQKEEMKQAAVDCRSALELFNIFHPRDWRRQAAYRKLSQPLQKKLEEDVVELTFVLARLEVWTVTPDSWVIFEEEDRRVLVDTAAHQRAIDVLQRIETISGPRAGVYAFLSRCWRELGRTDEARRTDDARKKLQPTTALDYYILGELLAKRGSSEQALERYRQALSCDPAHYLSLLAMGDRLAELGQLQAAEMALTGAITANPRPTFTYVKRALIRLRQDKRRMAMADFAEAVRCDPTLAKDYYARGHWNLERREFDQAISDWTAAVGLDPENAAAYFHRGLLYSEHTSEFDKAIVDFSRTIKLDPQRAEAYYSRGIAYDNRSEFDRAAADFGEALTRGLTRPDVYTRRATARALAGKTHLALEDYEEAIRLDPEYSPAFFERGTILCDGLSEFGRAIADLDAAVRINPEQPLAYFNRAVTCAAKGDLEGALAGWSEAIRLDPKFAQAYFERGILYCNGLDEFGRAVADFNETIRLDPERLVAYYNRGIACYNKGDLDQALASWTRAIQLGFTRVEVFCSRGILYTKRGDLQKSIADFDEAIRIDPQYAPAFSYRAKSRDALGQPEEAADDRAEATRLLDIYKTSTRSTKAAGEDSQPTTPLTGQASPERLVCASEEMMSCILRRTVSLQESRTMLILPLLSKLSRPAAIRRHQPHVRHRARLLRPHRLSHEPLEARHLLSTVSGTVFEDVDADGAQDVGEPGLEGWTVVLEPAAIDTPLLEIPNPSGVPEEGFAFPMVPVGNNLIAATSHADRNGVTGAGVAYLIDGSTGDVLQTFENPDPIENDQFGISLAPIANGKVVIGTRRDSNVDENGLFRAGVAYVLDMQTGALEQTIVDPNPAPTTATAPNWFGATITSIIAFRDGFLIGCLRDDTYGVDTGIVYHFDADGFVENTFPNPTSTANDDFGAAVAVIGDDVLVGAGAADTFGEDAGAFYLFDGEYGELLHTFSDPEPSPGDIFGRQVSVYGDRILAGARGDDTDGPEAGMAFVFHRDGTLLHTLHNPTPGFEDNFSGTIAINGDHALIRSAKADIGATNAGAAYLFDLTSGDLIHTYLNPTPEVDDYFGTRVGFLENGNVAIGSLRDDLGAVNSGAIYVYQSATATTSDTTGVYSFADVEVGTYRISQVSPEGYFQTAPAGDGSDTVIVVDGIPAAGPDFGMAPTTTTSYANTVPADLKDAKNRARPGITQSTLTVSDSQRIVDVNVQLSIAHSRPEDLDVFVIAPDGTRVELFTDVAGASGTTTLDDEAAISIVDAPNPFADAYRPEGSLSAFDGMSTEGTWTLEIADDTKGEVGTLVSWSLIIEHIPFPPPPAGITVEPTSGLVTTESGGEDTFAVVLDSEPTSQVTVAVASGNPGEGTVSPTRLMFDSTNWDTAQTVTVTGVEDDGTVDGDIAYTVVLDPALSDDPDYSGHDPADVSVINQDNDSTAIVFQSEDVPKEIADPHPRKGPRPTTSELMIDSTGIVVDLIDLEVTIDHASMSDLTIVTLTSPADTEAPLSYDGAYWDLVNPAAFSGESLDGTWTLKVADTQKNGIVGTLTAWSMTVTSLSESVADSSDVAAAVDMALLGWLDPDSSDEDETDSLAIPVADELALMLVR